MDFTLRTGCLKPRDLRCQQHQGTNLGSFQHCKTRGKDNFQQPQSARTFVRKCDRKEKKSKKEGIKVGFSLCGSWACRRSHFPAILCECQKLALFKENESSSNYRAAGAKTLRKTRSISRAGRAACGNGVSHGVLLDSCVGEGDQHGSCGRGPLATSPARLRHNPWTLEWPGAGMQRCPQPPA